MKLQKVGKNKQKESYESIVEYIKALYNGRLSDTEAHQAARNFIEFVKIMLEIRKKSS